MQVTRKQRQWVRQASSVTAALLGSALLLSACGSSSTPTKTSYTIGFSNPEGTQPVLNDFQAALTSAAARDGIKVTSLNAALSVSNQVSDIEQFITQKVKAIVVFPLAAQALVPVLTQARKAGIIVLGYNTVTSETESASSLYPYNADLNQGIIHQGAALAAAFVAKQLHGKGNVIGVDISAPVPSLHAFIGAEQVDVTAGNPQIHWLEQVYDPTDDIAGAEAPVADALTKYGNQINAVMAYFDGAGVGAADALKAAGVNAIVVGQQGNADGIAAIKSGELAATLNLRPYDQALIALAMVRDLVAHKSVPLVVHASVVLVTKANLGSYVPWSTGLAEVASGKLTPPTTITATGTVVGSTGS
ncbi:MAG: sugar ABC transporter substrate-binding protein [Candidatus Dormibacteria bacterium]